MKYTAEYSDHIKFSIKWAVGKNDPITWIIFGFVTDSLVKDETTTNLIAAVSTAVILSSLIPVILLQKVYGLQRLYGMETNSH